MQTPLKIKLSMEKLPCKLMTDFYKPMAVFEHFTYMHTVLYLLHEHAPFFSKQLQMNP